MTVTERNGAIRFLHTLAKGPALKSYGVQVAELAGLPASVTKRAKGLLRDLEAKKVHASSQLSLLDQLNFEPFEIENANANEFLQATSSELSAEVMVAPEVIRRDEILLSLRDEVQNYPLMQKSPLEAMNQIAKWKEVVSETLL
jgi:DNA mismatch repair protein MutS